MKKKIGYKYNKSYTDRWALKGFFFVLPALVLVAGFIIIPLILNFILAFTNYKGFGVPYRFIGIQNFNSIFTDQNFWLVLGNTFKLLLIYVVVLNALAIFLSVLIVDVGQVFGSSESLLYFPVSLPGLWSALYGGCFSTIRRD